MQLIDILSQLISFKSLPKNTEAHKEMFSWIENILKDVPVHITHESSQGFPSLIISTQKTKKPKVLLQSHTDVVDGPDSLFKANISDGHIYGRGAYDMKFAAASFIKLLLELGDSAPEYDISVMLTSDEEIGGANGVNFLLNEGYSADVCVLPDGGTEFDLEIASKGIWFFSVKSTGKSAHSSRPWEGENAIVNLVQFLNELQTMFEKTVTPHPEHFNPTINLAKITSPNRTDAVPGEAEAFVDIFYLTQEEYDSYHKMVHNLAEEYSGIEIGTKLHAKHFETDTTNIYSTAFQEIVEKHTGEKPSFTKSHGSSDARYFAEHNIPTILTRPKGGGHHGDHEWLHIEDYERFHAVVKDFVEQMGKK